MTSKSAENISFNKIHFGIEYKTSVPYPSVSGNLGVKVISNRTIELDRKKQLYMTLSGDLNCCYAK
jgi:hypothetical protein